jgi:predicted ATP-grasp superfamily ATP-dependent carboligase
VASEAPGFVRWEQHPELRRPVLIAAFGGWNDAGDAATLAVRYLAEVWSARRFATIDSEEFYDFTVTRPEVRLVDGMTRQIEWPMNELAAAAVPGSSRDAVLLRGVEPQLKWRTFSSALVGTARALGVQLVVTLGALLADVPHTRPVRVTGTAHEPDLAERLGLQRSNYEGPTGIVGVLHDACTQAGLPSASLWATVPHYVHQVPSPKAALALVERSAALVGGRVNPVELQAAADTYVREVSDRVADDEDASAYVAQLERADDDDALQDAAADVSGTDLAAEVERFLKDHGGG